MFVCACVCVMLCVGVQRLRIIRAASTVLQFPPPQPFLHSFSALQAVFSSVQDPSNVERCGSDPRAPSTALSFGYGHICPVCARACVCVCVCACVSARVCLCVCVVLCLGAARALRQTLCTCFRRCRICIATS